MLYANGQSTDARTVVSNISNELRVAERTLECEKPRLEEARAELEELRAQLPTVEVGSIAERRIERGIKRAEDGIPESEQRIAEAEEGPKSDADHVENWIDRLSLTCGEFVAYWAVIAVFVYYFEVISRYVFGAPTNLAHESMYLMFGMQYLITGAYAMLT